MHTQESIYMRGHDSCTHKPKPEHACGVSETMKGKFFALKTGVWNESHIIWQLFQAPFFQLYKALHSIFQKQIEILRENTNIHKKQRIKDGVFHKIFSSLESFVFEVFVIKFLFAFFSFFFFFFFFALIFLFL